jgi:hypothetical protein
MDSDRQITIVYPDERDGFVSPNFGVSVRADNFEIGDMIAFLERLPRALIWGQPIEPGQGCHRGFAFFNVPALSEAVAPYLLIVLARDADGYPVLPAVRPLRVRGFGGRPGYEQITISTPGNQAMVSPTFGTYGVGICNNTQANVYDDGGTLVGGPAAAAPTLPPGADWAFIFMTPLRATPQGHWDRLNLSGGGCSDDNHQVSIRS